MKVKSICAAVLILALASCSSYYQIATISSDNVKLNDNGEYSYRVGDIVVYYNFWSEYGSMSFIVENNSSMDIMIDISKSFFVKNGFAYDYYKNRTDVYTYAAVSTTSSKRWSTASSSSNNTSVNSYVESLSGVVVAGQEISSSYGVSNRNTMAVSNAAASMHVHSIEYKESDHVTIPAHSAKVFGEYSVTSGEFVKCGLIRNPSGREDSIANYNETNSPIVIENRLIFIVNGQELPVNSKFYVSRFENLPERKVLRDEYLVDCSGKKIGYSQKVNLFAQSNRYFVKYTFNRGDETCRIR